VDSYRLIGTYSTDSGNLGSWGGPASSVAFTVAGTSTPWGSAFGVSAFDVGATFGAGASDVLNTTSGYGSDELDMSSRLASVGTGTYSVTNASVFNWSGNPANPGFGCDSFSIAYAVGNDYLTDTLNASDWGLVRDYEMSLNAIDSFTVAQAIISNFQDVNIKAAGDTEFLVFGAQRGSFDFSGAQGALSLSTAAPAGTTSESAFTVQGAQLDSSVNVIAPLAITGVTLATKDYSGTPLITDGSTSLLDYITAGGSAADDINISVSNISANLAVSGGNENFNAMAPAGNLPSFGSWSASALEYGTGLVQLNPTGSGAVAVTASDASGVTIITGFQFGHDTLDMLLSTSPATPFANDLTLGTSGLSLAANHGISIMDPTGSHGVILAGMFPESVFTHMSVVTEGGLSHLLIA
jgi:hypothetical protein